MTDYNLAVIKIYTSHMETVSKNDLCVTCAEGTGGEMLHISMVDPAQPVHPAMEEDVKTICAIKVRYNRICTNIITVKSESL